MATGSQAHVSTIDLVDPFGDGSGKALYKFDGDATEESGIYNGTASSVIYNTGKFGQCVQSSSSESYVSFGIHHFNVPITFSFWGKGSIEVLNGQANNANATIFCTNTYVQMRAKNNATAGSSDIVLTLNSNISINTTIFNYFCVTVNYPNVVFYINGDIAAHGSMIYNVSPSYFPFGIFDIGHYPNHGSAGNCFDQFRIFNRALTQEEVTALYNEYVETYVPYVPPQGFFNDGSEVAHYTFDGDVLDSVNNYDGTASNLTYGTGKFGQCGVFNGSSSYAYILSSSYVFSPYASISFWIVSPSTINISYYFSRAENADVWARFGFLRYNNDIILVVNKEYKVVCPNSSLVANSHIVIICNNTTFSIYMNNVLINTLTFTGNITSSNNYGFAIGKAGEFNRYYSNSSIDQFRIFNRELTATEVTALYNEGQ